MFIASCLSTHFHLQTRQTFREGLVEPEVNSKEHSKVPLPVKEQTKSVLITRIECHFFCMQTVDSLQVVKRTAELDGIDKRKCCVQRALAFCCIIVASMKNIFLERACMPQTENMYYTAAYYKCLREMWRNTHKSSFSPIHILLLAYIQAKECSINTTSQTHYEYWTKNAE